MRIASLMLFALCFLACGGTSSHYCAPQSCSVDAPGNTCYVGTPCTPLQPGSPNGMCGYRCVTNEECSSSEQCVNGWCVKGC
ncbi:MAG: hypothetical protein ACJ790_01950 [Myxococcaceae bacterium]